MSYLKSFVKLSVSCHYHINFGCWTLLYR